MTEWEGLLGPSHSSSDLDRNNQTVATSSEADITGQTDSSSSLETKLTNGSNTLSLRPHTSHHTHTNLNSTPSRVFHTLTPQTLTSRHSQTHATQTHPHINTPSSSATLPPSLPPALPDSPPFALPPSSSLSPDKPYKWTTNPHVAPPSTTTLWLLGDVVQTHVSSLTSDNPLIVTTTTDTMMDTHTHLLKHLMDSTHTLQTHTTLLDISPTNIPLLGHTVTHTPLQKPTVTHTVLQKHTVTHTPLPEHTVTHTPLPEHTVTHTPLPKHTVTHTPLQKPTVTHALLPEHTVTHTPLPKPTVTHTPLPKPTVTHTPLPRPTVTHTPLPGHTVTHTPLPGHTVTHTPLPGHTVTHTPLPGHTVTHTPLPKHTVTHTPLPGHTVTHTPLPKHTVTHTPLPGHTVTHTPLPKHTVTHTARVPPSDHPATSISLLASNSPNSTSDLTKKHPSQTTKLPSPTVEQPPMTAQPSPWSRTSRPPAWTESYPSQGSRLGGTSSGLSQSTRSSKPRPRVYIVPDLPATVKEESIELLLQVILEDSGSDLTSNLTSGYDLLTSRLEDDTTAWVAPYLQRAPGFQDIQAVWSSGRAVQSVVMFRTLEALAWLGVSGAESLLERTGLAQAVGEGRSLRGSKVTNITVGGVQADVCVWLFQCAPGYECVWRPGDLAVCTSLCHADFCHNQGICTHQPEQLPLCQCPVGDHFWFMGGRCDVRMTRQRLVGACLGVLVAIVTVIGILACLAVRRYRAMLIQAKVDQTRSSYRRFNHFDELSGRFWGRSVGGSADSLDNPAFTRSDELLHLRALDRTCCYHDDTLSLASTCPSNGTHLNTVYQHSSQYGWALSEVSLAECVVDSGKASDLSVCSWPIEPIQWTPFPLLQQLASPQRTTTVRVPRPRSYCEGMELVELEKSWTT